MARIPSLNRTLSSTIPFARGVADRAVSAAGPILVHAVGRVTSRLPRRSRPEPSSPVAFAPAPTVVEHSPDDTVPVETAPEPAAQKPSAPSPAAVARNVAGPRPTAKRPANRKPGSVPGAKLPVTRPSA